MFVKGRWHDQGSAAQLDAELHSEEGRYTLQLMDGSNLSGQLKAVSVSDRLGRVERKLTLENGSVFVTDNNDAIDEFFKGDNLLVAILHRLESNLGWVLVAVIFTVASSVSFFRWGVPWAGETIAHAMPHKVSELIGSHTLGFLDDRVFEPSQLDIQRKKQIEAHFFSELLLAHPTDSEFNYQLHFRKMGKGDNSIANAFALPSGDIILTDRFVEIAINQDEIDAVLYHEIGHVVYRHTLEMVVQTTLLTATIMMVVGDSNGLADMGIGLGSLLVNSNYSRGHESEADLYAFNKMLEAGIDPNVFSQIIARIHADMAIGGSKKDDEKELNEDKNNNAQPDSSNHSSSNQRGANQSSANVDSSEPDKPKESTEKGKNLFDYLSSHPNTEKRIEQAERFSACFKKGLLVCEAVDN